MSRLTLVQRCDQRLQDRGGAVERSGIAPRLELVGGRNVPVRQQRRFVVVIGQVDAQPQGRHACLAVEPQAAAELAGEIEFGRGVIDRVPTDDQQYLHAIGPQIVDQFLQRGQLIDRIGLDRFDVNHRLADIAERAIAGVGQGMHLGRLAIARDHQGSTIELFQVADDRIEAGSRQPCRQSATRFGHFLT